MCLVIWKKWVVLYKWFNLLPALLHQDPPPMGTGTSLQHVVPLQTGKRGVALRHVRRVVCASLRWKHFDYIYLLCVCVCVCVCMYVCVCVCVSVFIRFQCMP